jgi:hypothetical protein
MALKTKNEKDLKPLEELFLYRRNPQSKSTKWNVEEKGGHGAFRFYI